MFGELYYKLSDFFESRDLFLIFHQGWRWEQGQWNGRYYVVPSLGQVYNPLLNNVNAAINDEISKKIFLTSGNYAGHINGFGESGSGKITIYVDNTPIASNLDFYASSGSPNVEYALSQFNIAKSGMKKLRIKVTDKNASSTSYRFYGAFISLRKA